MKKSIYIILLLIFIVSVSAKTEIKTLRTGINITLMNGTNSSSANVTIQTEEWVKTYKCNHNEKYERIIEFKRNVSISEEECTTMLSVCSEIGSQYSTLLPYISDFNYSEKWGICNGLKAEYKTKWENAKQYEKMYSNCTKTIEKKNNEIGTKQDELNVCIMQKRDMLTEDECQTKIEKETSSKQIYYLLSAGVGFAICWFWKVKKPEVKGGGEGTKIHAI